MAYKFVEFHGYLPGGLPRVVRKIVLAFREVLAFVNRTFCEELRISMALCTCMVPLLCAGHALAVLLD